jgi:hypothetical protein
MDTGDAVEYLARAEARRVRPFREEQELDEMDARLRLPAFTVRRCGSGSGSLVASPAPGREGLGHDNADRLPFLCAFLNRHVLPMVSGTSAEEGAALAGTTWRVGR